jgi:hypothetical protein
MPPNIQGGGPPPYGNPQQLGMRMNPGAKAPQLPPPGAPPVRGPGYPQESIQKETEVDEQGFPIPRKNPEFLPGALLGNKLDPEQEKFMKKFNTLDRGTYFIDNNNKTLHFLIQSNLELVGWVDDYVINGYILNGLIIKVKTLTSNVYIFIEPEHDIYKNYILEENGKLRWSDQITNELQILSITHIEKVEVYDNNDENFEGFICFIITEDSELAKDAWTMNLQNWVNMKGILVQFEPTSIRKVFLDSLLESLDKPESTEFNGKRIACIINPDLPGDTVKFSKRITCAFEKKCIVGSISCQYGIYTLMAEQVTHMQQFSELVEKALDIAEELGAYVMVTNLRRTFDYDGKTVLYLPSDPTLKILRYDGTLTFSAKCKKSISLN